MKKNLLYFFIFGLILFVFSVFFKSLNKSNIYVPNEVLNNNIINFTTKDFFSNNEIIFQELLNKKKFTILNIWASWCSPCRSEHQYLIKLNKNQNLNLIGLNYKDKKNNAKKFINDFGNPYSEILLDIDGTKSIEFGAYGIPETFIINNESKKIVKKYIGPIDQDRYNEILKITK